MLQWLTTLLPVCLFVRIARRCGVQSDCSGIQWHEARDNILVRNEKSYQEWLKKQVVETYEKRGVLNAIDRWAFRMSRDNVIQTIREYEANLADAKQKGK